MKRLFLIILTVFLNVSFFSCTSLDEDEYENPSQILTQGCCGDGETDPPPPPPPPPGGGGTNNGG